MSIDPRARLESLDHAVQHGQRDRHEEVAVPGTEAALDAGGALRAECVIVEADSGAERFGDPLEHLHRLRQAVEHPHAERGMLGVGEHGHRLGRHREPLDPVPIRIPAQQLRGRLVVGPLAHPALLQPRGIGELL